VVAVWCKGFGNGVQQGSLMFDVHIELPKADVQGEVLELALGLGLG